MNEESLAVDMQKFAYKPKETLRPGSWYLLWKSDFLNIHCNISCNICW